MGLLLELDIKKYWTKTCRKGVNYFAVREYISKDYWQQINLKLYISLPKYPNSKIKKSPFYKIVTLNNTLYNCFW